MGATSVFLSWYAYTHGMRNEVTSGNGTNETPQQENESQQVQYIDVFR